MTLHSLPTVLSRALKDMKDDSVFMDKFHKYRKLKWERIKKRAILDFGYIPIVIFSLFVSVLISMAIFVYLFLQAVYPLTPAEISLLFSEPMIIIVMLIAISIIPITVFWGVLVVVGITIKVASMEKELEKELKED